MKKNSKVIGVLVALVLVLCVAFGGTLAYLTATPDNNTLTNTFTATAELVTNKSENFKLTESKVKLSQDGNSYEKDTVNPGQVTSQTYANLLQGMQMYKDPTVTITSGKINAQSYLYVVVNESNVDGVLTWAIDDAEFTDITTTVNTALSASNKEVKDGYKVLVYKTNNENKIAIGEEVNGNIIEGNIVTVANVDGLISNQATLTFSAYLCQTAGFASQEAALVACFGSEAFIGAKA